MSQDPISRSGGGDEEALRRFLEETFGGALPPEALEGVDLSELAKHANLPTDPAMLKAAAAQMQHMFAAQDDGPVNWTLAQDLARRTAQGAVQIPGAPAPEGTPGDPNPSEQQVRELRDAANIAALWLADAIDLDLPAQDLEVWSRGTWLHRTLPRWQSTVEPVAKYMASAIGDAIGAQLRQADMALPGDPAAMMERMGGTMFGVQFGHAIGSLAREVTGTTDLSLPLGPEGRPALVAANVQDLIAQHDLDAPAARIFLAARELAHTTLFARAPWLGRALFSAIEDYARGITLDLDALDEMVRDIDLSDPAAMQARRPEEMFRFTRRASQERALQELSTTLALVEAWVDHVTTQALTGKLPQLEALREVLRRRRASGSPAEEMLSRTVGIELRPRRVREALAWWDSVLATEGVAGREAKWAHPDLLPSLEVLTGTPQAPRPDAAPVAGAPAAEPGSGEEPGAESEGAAGKDDLEGMVLPADFDAELARLLDEAGEGDAGSDGDSRS
ncbi:zinc-dependent metalloprotease [Brachybacterium sp. JHP9]|uniref:Zinc-dependent metalloprotease n=1 Tax=Brachybacterium equifaecis TaxID=2910770 RepID=A0ABT0QWD4_9MICO|nr:zinc-dependent metalloprotease [Brachybacterium equifaecis]MCL6421980.1 zinc-dependent metalloprotease [Brachybacterium equifaecis]